MANRHLNFYGRVKRYNHNLSYRNFLSFEIGELRPIWLEDGVPGDTIQYKPEVRFYFAPLVFPVLSAFKARVDVWFVPNRLAIDDWENLITGGPDGQASPAYPSIRNVYHSLSGSNQGVFATMMTSQIGSNSSLLNDLGHPTITGMTGTDLQSDPYDLVPLYDFQFIYDENYRDEEKEASITSFGGIRRDLYDVCQDPTTMSMWELSLRSNLHHRVAWAKDYFTTASLKQQRGGDVPLLSGQIFKFVGGAPYNSNSSNIALAGTSTQIQPAGKLVATSDSGTAELQSVLTINGLRELYAASAWLNNNVVGGTRYREQLLNRYHVVYSDARLQVPELVGSCNIPVQVDVVTQTSATIPEPGSGDGVYALGDRTGKASVVGSGQMMTYSCEEFGYFIAILHVAPKAAYFQGIRRNLQREDRFDFWSPEFEKLPQRPIFNNEIYADANTLDPENGGTFGYTGIFNEYRFHNDEVHGDFQDSLLAWTTARKFSAVPSAVSEAFLRVDSNVQGNNRIFAAPLSEESHIYGVVNNIVLAKRLISNVEPKF